MNGLFLQAEGWELFNGADEGSGADTEMEFELLDGVDGSGTAEGSRGADDADLALRQKQREQRAYEPPEPTQVLPACSPPTMHLFCLTQQI